MRDRRRVRRVATGSESSSRDGDEHGRFRAGVVQRAKRKASEPQDRTRCQASVAARHALELDLAVPDDDERIAPFASRRGRARRPGPMVTARM